MKLEADSITQINQAYVDNMDSIFVSKYTGYCHNRYDGYDMSWGVVMACGGSPTADCFAEDNDFPDSEFGNDLEELNLDDSATIETILSNLAYFDYDEMLSEISDGYEYDASEYFGDEIPIKFYHWDKNIILVNFGNNHWFICDF